MTMKEARQAAKDSTWVQAVRQDGEGRPYGVTGQLDYDRGFRFYLTTRDGICYKVHPGDCTYAEEW